MTDANGEVWFCGTCGDLNTTDTCASCNAGLVGVASAVAAATRVHLTEAPRTPPVVERAIGEEGPTPPRDSGVRKSVNSSPVAAAWGAVRKALTLVVLFGACFLVGRAVTELSEIWNWNLASLATGLVLAFWLGLIGTLVAAATTFAIGFGGAPGALLGHYAMSRSGTMRIPGWALLLTLAGQTYVVGAHVAFVVSSTRALLTYNPIAIPGVWIVWFASWWVAIAPGYFAARDAAYAEQRNIQHFAAALTFILNHAGFFLFVYFPDVLTPWAWVPSL